MKVTLIGYTTGVYIIPQTNEAIIDYTKAENWKDVRKNGVDHLVIRREQNGSLRIIQAGGYTRTRGMFVDSY